MTKDNSPKTDRTKDQLFDALRMQVGLAIDYCYLLDHEREDFVLPLANLLRLLFKQGSNTTSLLGRLQLREIDWVNSAIAATPTPGFTISESSFLTGYEINRSGKMQAVPHLVNVDPGATPSLLNFEAWWNEAPIALSEAFGAISRGKLVETVADKDGAHTDKALPDWYWAIKTGEFLTMKGAGMGTEVSSVEGVVAASVRQIAHEAVLTLASVCPACLPQSYRWRNRFAPPGQVATLTPYFGPGRSLGEFRPHDPANGLVITGVVISTSTATTEPGPHLSVRIVEP